MNFLMKVSILILTFFHLEAQAVMVSHQCTLSEVRNNSAPCNCPVTTLTQPFCPRLEGIKIPCIVKVSIGSCTYDNGQPAPQVCLVAKSCDVQESNGICNAALEDYDCSSTINGECLAEEQYDCSTTSQGSCISYNEAGTICTGYETITTPKTCTRCKTYERITVPKTCQRCTAGYGTQTVHYNQNESKCGCETYSTP